MYDPVAYWTAQGRTYEADLEAGRIGHGYAEQEAALVALLRRMRFHSVLEVGCGYGRITRLIAKDKPSVAITGLDLSADQLERFSGNIPDAEAIQSTIQDFDARERRWDLVLAVEVLMHVPPAELPAVIDKLRSLARHHLVTVDWSEDRLPATVAPWNFQHDYAAAFGDVAETIEVGRQRIFRIHVPHPGSSCR